MATTDYAPIISLTQQSANQVLAEMGCRQIGVDGSLGPETCGAIQFILANQGSVPVSGAMVTVQTNQWLTSMCTKPPSYSCQAAAPSPATAAPPPAATLPGTTAASFASMSSADMVMWGTVLAAVGLVGYAVAKKKGWIK